MDPLELLELLKAKRDAERTNLLHLIVHILLTSNQNSEFKVSEAEIEAYCDGSEHELVFEHTSDGFYRLRAKTTSETVATSSHDEMVEKARKLAEEFIATLGGTHGKH